LGSPGHQQGVRYLQVELVKSRVVYGSTKERRLKPTSGTLQGEANAGNAADDTLMVDQGGILGLTPLFLWSNLLFLNESKQILFH
jgi:hypothetical protein